MLLEVEGRALNEFNKRYDIVAVTCLIEFLEGLELDFHRFDALPPSKVICKLHSVPHNGESINIFADRLFEYFHVCHVL